MEDERQLPQPSESNVEALVARSLIVLTFAFALLAQSLLFHTAALIGGDARYHRGVALTMSAGNFQGEGPIHGLITYFGGLYPLTLGWGSRLLGVDFDRLLSITSWFAVLVLPYALLRLGRAIWPREKLEVALLVFLGTIGSSLGTDTHARWVYSALPSGANTWPLYPRDIALLLLIAALTLVVADDSPRRILAAAVISGITICVHAQLGMYTVAVLLGHIGWQALRDHQFRIALRRSVVTVTVALAVSAWWWIPRVFATFESSRLFLASYPGLPAPDTSLMGFVITLGPIGLLAIPGVVLATRDRGRARFFGIWLIASLPLVLIGRLAGDAGVITERRVWFFAAVPLIVCATAATAAVFRRVPAILAAVVLVPLIVVPATFELVQVSHDVADWTAPPAGSAFDLKLWQDAERALRAEVLAHGSAVVLAPDNDAVFVWSETGAQPYSLWLPGSVKLGFDPAALTGTGYLQRVRHLDAAFRAGIPGLCRLARTSGSRLIVLRQVRGLIGTHDIRPAAPYRVGPARRDKASIDRIVGPGIRYLDFNPTDMLQLNTGAAIDLVWNAPRVRLVEVYQYPPTPAADPLVMQLPDGRTILPHELPTGAYLKFATPNGVPPGTKLVARTPIAVERVIGYEAIRGVHPHRDAHAPIALPVDRTCRG